MSDVRFLASQAARSTGIQRTSAQVPQRTPAGIVSSHVSAAPSADARAQQQVISARRPPGSRQETTVAILERRPSAGAAAPTVMGAAAASQLPIVQVVEPPSRSGVGESQRPIVQVVERPSRRDAAPSFSVEQLMLIASLLERYRENSAAIHDAPNTGLAEGALAVLAGALQAAGAPAASSPAGRSSELTDAGASARVRRPPRARGGGKRVDARAPAGRAPAVRPEPSASLEASGSSTSAMSDASPTSDVSPTRM